MEANWQLFLGIISSILTKKKKKRGASTWQQEILVKQSRQQEGNHIIGRIWSIIIYTWYYVFRRHKLHKLSEFCKTAMLTVWYFVSGKHTSKNFILVQFWKRSMMCVKLCLSLEQLIYSSAKMMWPGFHMHFTVYITH